MFFSLKKWHLTAVIDTPEMLVAKIQADELVSANGITDAFRGSPVVSHSQGITEFLPKYWEYIIVGKGYQPLSFNKTEIDTLKNTLPRNHWSMTDSQQTLKDFIGKLERSLGNSNLILEHELGEYFFVGRDNEDVDVENFSFRNNVLRNLSKNGTLKQDEASPTVYSLEWESTPNNALGIIFMNKFETIHLSFDNLERFGINLNDVVKRASNPVRINGDYLILPTTDRWENAAVSRVLPQMTVENMLVFFENGSRRGTKLDTFIDCLKGSCNRHSPAYDAIGELTGKQFMIDIVPGNSAITTKKIVPFDQVLAMSSYLKILSAEEFDNGSIRLLTEVKATHSDDFANVLYGAIEKQKSSLRIGCIDPEILEATITQFMLANIPESK